MPLPTTIRRFFGAVEPAPDASPRAVSVISLDVLTYALSLASKPEALAAQRKKFNAAVKSNQSDITLIDIYLEIERYLVEEDPVRTFERQELRDRIRQRFDLSHAWSGLPLLFDPPAIQQVRLSGLVLVGILQRVGRFIAERQVQHIVEEATKGGPLAGIELSASGLKLGLIEERLESLRPEEFEPVFRDIAKIFNVLLIRLKDIEGTQIAQIFEQSYLEVKAHYDDFVDSMPEVASLLPEGILEEEKLRFLSRDTLEQKVKEKTKQLEAEKASIELKVKQRTEELILEQAKFAQSIESLSVGLLMVDDQDRVIIKNTAASRVLGYGQRQWDVQDFNRDLGGKFDLIKMIGAVKESGHQRAIPEVNLASKILRLTLTPVLARKRTIGVVILVEDITEAKIVERSRDEFFSIASHELRTPLTAIRGNTSLIQQYYKKLLKDKDLKDMVGDIHDSSIRLIEIVNDFLDASRLEQDKMQFTFEDFDIADLIEKVVYELSALGKEKHIYVRADSSITAKRLQKVCADSNRVKQVLYNLIGNAMKFVDEGGVSLTASASKGHLKILISDTGPGISPEGQKLLFHKFQQTGKSIITRDNTRGTGLGLYISKLLLERMNGQIKLESSVVGEGSVFSFTLPLASKAVSKSANEAASYHKTTA
jgi:signal transduction histidine kinase